MYKIKLYQYIILLGLCLTVISCKVPAIVEPVSNNPLPDFFNKSQDINNIATTSWRTLFKDAYLINLIDEALKNNQELLITLQEIEIAKNDIGMRKGALLPSVGLRAGMGVEKVGLYTSQGAGDASAQITPGNKVPESLGDFKVGVYANWEVDIWKKLRNSKKAAVTRYLSTIEGKNFVLTNLIAEIADSYYELLSLDSKLQIVRQTIELQKNAFEIVKVQKEAARATELGVQKFQAEVLSSQNKEYEIIQNIKEVEFRINFLLGRYPKEIGRDKTDFLNLKSTIVSSGIPSQLLINRPDVKQAELNLVAAKLDVKVARAEFFPSLGICAGLGLRAFNPSYLLSIPESILYSLMSDIAGPIINKNAIKAEFNNANARQIQALYNYDKTILNAYLEVATQLSKISNLDKSFELKSKQVDALNKSIDISNDLFKSARVDYFEVLMTQRDALETKLELVETKKEQLNAVVHIYKSLGGGWR